MYSRLKACLPRSRTQAALVLGGGIVFSYCYGRDWTTTGSSLISHNAADSGDSSGNAKKVRDSFMEPVARSPTTVWNENWDGRVDQTHSNPKIKHQIILIRHGQYKPSKEKIDEEQVLTDIGIQQAQSTGQRLVEMLRRGVFYPIDRLFYSTMKRATQTWIELAKQLQATAAMSSSSSSSSTSTAAAIKSLLPPASKIEPCSMIREVVPFRPIPWENWDVRDEVFFKNQQQAEAAFLNYFHRPDLSKKENYSTVLVCHGNMIRYLTSRALQLPPETWKRIAVWNASITVLEIDAKGRVSLQFFTDIGHLPPHLVTYG